jgi:competence protein ComEC
LTARFFNLFSPVALVGNLLVVPLAFVVVLTGCLSVLSGSLVPLLAEVFNHANRLFISLLLSGIEAFRSIPGGHRFVVAPPWWILAVWYAGLVAVVMFRGRSRRVAAVVAVTLLCLGGAQRWFDRSVTMDVLDVGEGQAVLINLPDSGDVLVDAGSRYRVRNVLRHLRAEGVNRLRVLALTHADADHVGGALDVMDAVAVDEVWLSPFPGRSTMYVPVIEEAGRRGIPVREMDAGHRGEWAGRVGWEMLSPEPDGRYRRARDGSLVLRVARDAWSILLMGGAGADVEQGLLSQPCSLAATVLVPGDPARSGLYSDEWMAAVEPDYVTLSVNGREGGGYLDPSALDRMARDSIRVLRTDRQGHIRFRFRPGLRGPAGQPEVETVRGDEDLSV